MFITDRRTQCSRWLVAAVGTILASLALAADDPPPPPRPVLTLDDLFAEEGAADAAVSPSGKYIASVLRRKDEDVLILYEVATGKPRAITSLGRKDIGARYDAHISEVYWKSEDRLLFRVAIAMAKGIELSESNEKDLRNLGTRLFAIDRESARLVRLLGENHNRELNWAFDLGAIRSFLPRDPDNILMVVDGEDGRSLFKVNVQTGVGEVIEHADVDVIDWWLDVDGVPVVRVESSNGFLRFYRHENSKHWKAFYKVRLRELKQKDDYEAVGPSDQPGKYYVLARPEGAQRRGIYLYDLEHEDFGKPIAENPDFDITAGFISRDGTHVQRYCYVAHVQICESADPGLNAHMTGIRKFFDDSANVYVADSSDDSETLLLFVEGPSDPPSYFYYLLGQKKIQRVGLLRSAMAGKALPTATLVEYQGRDGMKLTGYLTRPPGAASATRLPLVMMPHGGPEARDYLTFDTYVQYFAALGYAVFQPNFRGSDGFGHDFVQSGYGQWGRKMQDDISDAVALLVAQKVVDPARVCIVGASYGGYAALAGATLTPDLYKCVVSIAGIGDLDQFLKFRRKKHGKNSELYAYWMRQIGDPEHDAEQIAAVSPAMHVDRIKAPILLIHGDADTIVPYEQSKEMKKLLDKSGRKTPLITLKNEDHSFWTDDDERLALSSVGDFLMAQIGPGFGKSAEKTQ